MRKYLYGTFAFVLTFAILSVSVLRSASVSPAYGFSSTPKPLTNTINPTPTPEVPYYLPFPGKILPDNWLWYFKAGRDRSQYFVTGDALKKADLALLFSDKRLAASISLFEKNKPDLAVSVLTKGEKYLEMSLENGKKAVKDNYKTDEFLIKLAMAALRHRQIIEEQIMPKAPEDLRPEMVKASDYSKNTYKVCRDMLAARGIPAPKDPFNGQ